MRRKGVIAALMAWNAVGLIITTIVIVGLVLGVAWVLGLIKFI